MHINNICVRRYSSEYMITPLLCNIIGVVLNGNEKTLFVSFPKELKCYFWKMVSYIITSYHNNFDKHSSLRIVKQNHIKRHNMPFYYFTDKNFCSLSHLWLSIHIQLPLGRSFHDDVFFEFCDSMRLYKNQTL